MEKGQDRSRLLERSEISLTADCAESIEAALQSPPQRNCSSAERLSIAEPRQEVRSLSPRLGPEATEYAIALLKVAPEDQTVRLDLCQRYFNSARFEAARLELLPLVELEHPRAVILAARCHLVQQEVDKAIAMLERFLSSAATDVTVLAKARSIALQYREVRQGTRLWSRLT